MNIHPTAIVDKNAIIGKNVEIGPYAIIGPNVRLDDNVVIKAHALLDGHTTVGEGSIIWPYAVIGTKTQDLKFKGEITYVQIGKHTEIREFVTVNASCGEGTIVKVGDRCLIMAYCHVAHNCEIGNRVIMSNNATLAGHVTVDDFAVIGGLSAVHQFSRIGRYAMVGGMSRVTHDVPPFTIGAGSPYHLGGLNLVGLRRNNVPLETRKLLTQAFRTVYRSGLRLQEALELIESQIEQIPEIKHWVEFCRTSKRGLIDHAGITLREKDPEELELDTPVKA
ncbi:MAG: acyl-ACP--UDP-N-acetylglucosamine O-acyltransferase [Verrucomicrobia bacterium]|nr:acyl-ACP--UDP-N-acetylglucosamine O-acyltransferase [Verrucomicrobiota bacterium]MBS0637558.1 acyl-ACP--UDP-N-acetylglucosamine O-acyltransferase [Verrucomicrobiota bacterium]